MLLKKNFSKTCLTLVGQLRAFSDLKFNTSSPALSVESDSPESSVSDTITNIDLINLINPEESNENQIENPDTVAELSDLTDTDVTSSANIDYEFNNYDPIFGKIEAPFAHIFVQNYDVDRVYEFVQNEVPSTPIFDDDMPTSYESLIFGAKDSINYQTKNQASANLQEENSDQKSDSNEIKDQEKLKVEKLKVETEQSNSESKIISSIGAGANPFILEITPDSISAENKSTSSENEVNTNDLKNNLKVPKISSEQEDSFVTCKTVESSSFIAKIMNASISDEVFLIKSENKTLSDSSNEHSESDKSLKLNENESNSNSIQSEDPAIFNVLSNNFQNITFELKENNILPQNSTFKNLEDSKTDMDQIF